MKYAKTLHVCGTGSGVGKSVIVSALCRIFLQDGYKVCPFKAQNMALNSYVTKEGGEIGRAQAFQAEACRIEPHVDMNPILMKPTEDRRAQIIVHGKPIGNMSAVEYVRKKRVLAARALESFDRLKKRYELVILEGAGSPAEINLKRHDIVNFKMAEYARAPVVIVGDIDKGGVFAWLTGTLDLLDEGQRKMVRGFIINKFRGDVRLLKSGLDFLEKRTGVKVLGVIPYFHPAGPRGIKVTEEDSVPLDGLKAGMAERIDRIKIDVVHLPHISNFTDFDALEKEPDVRLRYIKDPGLLSGADVVIIPGTKNTAGDLGYLKVSGFAGKIKAMMKNGDLACLVGICGGFQMLGDRIHDPRGTESRCGNKDALGLVRMETVFGKKKLLSKVKALEVSSGLDISGYEIHHGVSRMARGHAPAFRITERLGRAASGHDGVVSGGGRIYGTYIHGIFDADAFRRDFLDRIRRRKGWSPLIKTTNFNPDLELDKLASLVRDNIDMRLVRKIIRDGL